MWHVIAALLMPSAFSFMFWKVDVMKAEKLFGGLNTIFLMFWKCRVNEKW